MKRVRFKPVYILVILFATIWLAISIIPFYYMVGTSLKSANEYFTTSFFSFPKKLAFSNYAKVLKGDFLRYFFNSIVVVSLSLVILLIVGALASYPFSRFKFKLNKPLYLFVVACMSLPIHVTLIPIYLLSREIGTYNTVFALVGPYVAFNLPVTIFIVTGFMREVPLEIEESAKIDGCGKFRMFFSIMLPMSKPGIATVAIYNTVSMWNEFVFALVLIQSQESRTLPLSLWAYQGQYSTDVPMILSVLTLSAIPMIIAFAVGQDKLIKGMMVGAVKG